MILGLMIMAVWASGAEGKVENKILSADIESKEKIVIRYSGEMDLPASVQAYSVTPAVKIREVVHEKNSVTLQTATLSIQQNYTLKIDDAGEFPLRHMGILDGLYSDKELGVSFDEEHTIFRLFAPRATEVKLEIFDKFTDTRGGRYFMRKDENGVWEYSTRRPTVGKYYGYRVKGPGGNGEMFDENRLLIDPYAKAVKTENHYLHRGKALIFKDEYDWEGDTFLEIQPEDLVILEAHVRDLTAHSSAGGNPDLRGSYLGVIDESSRGGINYLRDLGVNAVELLPVQDFGNIEIPYESDETEVRNTWNPYERNHWGYMTAHFFAPETYYASKGTLQRGAFSVDGEETVREFKDMVKALHRNGIAVILDVVYNHVAQYEQNAFKFIDKKYYFRLNGDLNFSSYSGCGNDFKTERPMARRLIFDSIKYWLETYHVDGFRFDLAALFDWETLDFLREEARKINPNVILIAEPWGGGEYEPKEMSEHGFSAWNDQFRNGVKGQNPHDGLGFIFGEWQGSNDAKTLKSYVLGTRVQDGGLFQSKAHSVNYLESHDDHTLGDFIRIGSKRVDDLEVVRDVLENAKLSERELKMHKLAAMFLLTSQGSVMLAQGQDWGRSKVIARTSAPDVIAGRIDHNSYEKDDETNWLNYLHREMNRSLTDYYKGMIALRKKQALFRRASDEQVEFIETGTPFSMAYSLKNDRERVLVILNGNAKTDLKFDLPVGRWEVFADDSRAGTEALYEIDGSNDLIVPPTTGAVLSKKVTSAQ